MGRRKRKRDWWSWLGIGAIGMVAAGFWLAFQSLPYRPVQDRLILAEHGQSPYRVFLPKAAAPAERYAAQEFVRFFAQSTGVQLPLIEGSTPTGPSILLGRNHPLTQRLCRGLDWSRLGEDGFLIRTIGKHLIITGAHPRGTLYGVYWFLREELGCRWFAVDTTVVPRHSTLQIRRLNEIHLPRLRYREIFYPEAEPGDFAARLMLNGQMGHRTYTRPLQPKHGGAVYLISGYNNEARPAMDPETRRRAVASVRKALHRVQPTGLSYVLIDHIDGGIYYNRGQDAQVIRAGGSPSAPLMDLTCAVARKIQPQYPRIIVLGSAYLWSRKPCTNLVFPDNAGVCFAPIEADWSRPFDAPVNRSILHDLDGWCKRTQHILIWLYGVDYNNYLQPMPNIFPMIRTIQLLSRRSHVEGIFLEGAYNSPGAHMAALQTWVFAHLLWNPNLDGRRLIEQFMQGYYGPAAPMLLQYLDLLHQSAQEHPCKVGTKAPLTLPYLNARFLLRADELMRQAEQATAATPLYRKHVQIARMWVDSVFLLNGARLREEAKRQGLPWHEDPKRLERFRKTVALAGVTHFSEDLSIQTILQAMTIPRKLPPPPSLCKGLPDDAWVDAQDLSFVLAGPATFVADPKASDGGAVRMPGQTDVWGIQLPLSTFLPAEGKWKLYAVVRVEKDQDNPQQTALRLGVDPGPSKPVLLQDLSDGAYHIIPLPGGPYTGQTPQTLWIAPPNSHAIRFLYVDRIFAVRAQAHP